MTDHQIRMEPVGHVVTGYARPQDTPPQSSENRAEPARVVMDPRYVEGLSGLEACPHIWLVTWLHAQSDDEAAELRCVPRGGSQARGVFSTRSPNRPNRVGMSLVRLVGIDGDTVHFEGVDLADGTPVLDIKPWTRGTDVPPA